MEEREKRRITEKERERKRETHTHTHTHTEVAIESAQVREGERGDVCVPVCVEKSLHRILARTSGNFIDVRKRENIHGQIVKRFDQIRLLPYTIAVKNCSRLLRSSCLYHNNLKFRIINFYDDLLLPIKNFTNFNYHTCNYFYLTRWTHLPTYICTYNATVHKDKVYEAPLIASY